jgi:hypothetical protein
MLTQEKVRELFVYREDGSLVMKTRTSQRVHVGDVVGYDHQGYIRVKVSGKDYYAHRLVWLYHHGYLPENPIDHINRNKMDNRIENLREVSHSCNLRNIGNRKDSNSGAKGVSYHSGKGKWGANIKIPGKQVCLGYYQDILEAACHRLAAEQALDWAGCDSSSPAFQYVKKYIPHIK